LAAELSGDVLSDDLTRAMYSTAAGIYQVLPLGIVRPRDRSDILTTLRRCRETGTPVTLRGGGTSPADGCLGRGVIIDTSAYLCQEGEIDVHEDTVTAPPGITYAQLNAALSRFGRALPPDPPGGDCRTLGGMIATNAAGINSAKYGSIIDYVDSLELVLADGLVIETRPIDTRRKESKEAFEAAGPEARLCSETYELLRTHRGLIRSRSPRLPVGSSGYRLDQALWRSVLDLGKLATGSEGTLAVITRATLRTVEPLPVHGMLVFYFENVQLAADSVRPILDEGPCSVELIDARAVDQVRATRPDLAHFHRDKAQSLLLVEFDGADNDEVIAKLMTTQRLIAEDGATAMDSVGAIAEPDVQEARDLRKCAAGLLHTMRGAGRVTPVMEDLAVAPDMVSSCVRGLSEIMKRHGLEVTIRGQVGHGGLCARPLLDLKDAGDIRKMREAAEEVFEMVVEMGGTISGGQGDGLARSEFLRLEYGELCDVFAEVKRLFDPDCLLNPGVKVGAERGTVTTNLRYGAEYSRRRIPPKLLHREEPRGDLIERCHGCGACRTLDDEVAMCPVYKALRIEEASPRAKANILRHRLANTGALPPEAELVSEMGRLTDLCLNCTMCSVECPSSIDVAKLMVELRARRAEQGGLSLEERVAKRWPRIVPWLAAFAPVANLLVQSRAVRVLAEKLLGVASRRELPRLRPRERRGRHKPTLTQAHGRVVYVTGTHTDCFTPEVAQCAIDVLVRNGIEVEVVSGLSSGETRMTYGDIAGARRVVERNVRRIEPFVRDGFHLVFTDPRWARFFRKGMLDCIDTPAAASVASASFDLMQYLLSLHRAGQFDTRFRGVPVPFAYHAPCHLRALQIGKPSMELLRLVPDLPVADLNGGCCGMAGTFGLRASTYDLSMRIGRPLFEQIRTLEVRYGLTECGTCAMQLQQGAGKRVLHPIQILHRAYGLSEHGMDAW